VRVPVSLVCAAMRAMQPCYRSVDDENDWLPNPYQDLADAQVMSGAWPGTQLLLSGATSRFSDCGEVHLTEVQHWLPHIQPSAAAAAWASPMLLGVETSCAVPTTLSRHTSADSSQLETECGSTSGSAMNEHSIDGSDQDSTPSSRSSKERFSKTFSHSFVPKVTELSPKTNFPKVTTLMIRNIPNAYTRAMFVTEIDALGLTGTYDFLYLPIDKNTEWNVGYAFVNFLTPEKASECNRLLTNHTFRCFEHNSAKITKISPAHIQGLEKNLAYYQKTAVHCAGRIASRPLVLPGGHHSDPAVEP